MTLKTQSHKAIKSNSESISISYVKRDRKYSIVQVVAGLFTLPLCKYVSIKTTAAQ